MDKRGQLGILSAIGSYVGFLLFFFAFLGKLLSDVGDIAMLSVPTPTGVEAIFYTWLNLWVFLAATLGFLVWAGFSLRA